MASDNPKSPVFQLVHGVPSVPRGLRSSSVCPDVTQEKTEITESLFSSFPPVQNPCGPPVTYAFRAAVFQPLRVESMTRVLVADSSSTMRKIIARSLAALGITEVVEAGDGAEAAAAFRAVRCLSPLRWTALKNAQAPIKRRQWARPHDHVHHL